MLIALLPALFPVLPASVAVAQSAACPGGAPLSTDQQTQDGCEKLVDLIRYLTPQMGAAIAGGNAVLGQGAALGVVGRLSVSVRGTAVFGSMPRISDVSLNTAADHSRSIPVAGQMIVAPAADVALGVYRGLALHVTNILAVDALASVAYMPGWESHGVRVRFPDGGIKLGFGARIGLLQESLIVPGIGVTYLRRGMPVADVTATPQPVQDAPASTLIARNMTLTAQSWRVVASKSFVVLSVAIGAGRDQLTSEAEVQAIVYGTTGDVHSVEQSFGRTTAFADVSLRFLLLRVVGEVGLARGGEIGTFNSWDGAQPTATRCFTSLGGRLTF
jgi:hypothetical protein